MQEAMNRLLAIANEAPSLVPTRRDATGKYADVLVSAFYDCMTPETPDYLGMRESEMPLPVARAGKKRPPRALAVGTTGVGKSKLLQHILQTTNENFPMRGAGRTTVADIEIIVDDVDFGAVITFVSENAIREVVRENVIEACLFARAEKREKRKIGAKLLVDSDKQFRFNHMLGGWPSIGKGEGEEDDDDEDLEEEFSPLPENGTASTWQNIEDYVDRIVTMTEVAIVTATTELRPSSKEDEGVLEEYWPQYIDQNELDSIVEEIVDELQGRLCAATGKKSWPITHCVSDTKDREKFFSDLRLFYDNHRSLFGRLVTPLVQGIRVRGRFAPPAWAAESSTQWVLLDGQGVGHEQRSATKINRTVPPELTRKYADADVICLVDRAVPAMTGDAPGLLEDLIVRGHLDRLVLVFTHFEATAAPDLDSAGKKEKVLEGVSSAIQSIASLPKAQKVLLEQTIESRAFFLARLNAHQITGKATQGELKRLCARLASGVAAEVVHEIRPVFNEYQIANAVRQEIAGFRNDWSEDELAGYHWKIIEALTNWVGNAYSDGYPRRNLYPAQDLSRRLVAVVSRELESPKEWLPHIQDDAEAQSRTLNAIRNIVGPKIDAYCKEVVIHDLRTIEWLPAYVEIGGTGTKIRRARRVARILEDHAQLPEEGVGKFAKAVWKIVEDAIREVCENRTEVVDKRPA